MSIEINTYENKTIHVYGLWHHPDIGAFYEDFNAEDNDQFNDRLVKSSVKAPNGKHICFVQINDTDSEVLSYDTDTDDLATLADLAGEFLRHPLKYV